MRRWIRTALLALPLVGAVAYLALPGWHSALTPQLFGVQKLGPKLYSDAPHRAHEFRERIKAARSETAAFFGEISTEPTYIICTTEPCQRRFGIGPRGLNLGKHFILIAPLGINQVIITHERVHNELHRTAGINALYDPDFPAWFDEGLATLLSRDTRLATDPAPEWIYTAHNWRDWRNMTTAETWRANYGAAMSVVARYEAQNGRDGLRKLVARVEAGEDFHALWQESYARTD